MTRTNKSSGEVVSYGWDAQDQLVSVGSSEGWNVTFAYDAQQRRVGKTYTATDGTITTQVFVYDGPNVLFVFTTSGGVTKARRWMNAYGLDKRYGFEDYASAAPNPGTGTVYEVHQDYLGSIVAVVDPTTGTQVSKYRYDSFGQRTVLSEGVKPGYGFTGQQFDEETGLGYFRARYYDPKEGRFVSSDPLGFGDGIPNSYAYVTNAPYGNSDPWGLSSTVGFSKQAEDASSNGVRAESALGAVLGALLKSMNQVEQYFERNGSEGLNPYLSFQGGGGGSVSPNLGAPGSGQCFGGPIGSAKIAVLRISFNGGSGQGIVRPHGGVNTEHWPTMRRRSAALIWWSRRGKGVVPGTVRPNQRQVNYFGFPQSTCRPDIQWNNLNGVHHLEEVHHVENLLQNVAKMQVMQFADPLPTAARFIPIGRTRYTK